MKTIRLTQHRIQRLSCLLWAGILSVVLLLAWEQIIPTPALADNYTKESLSNVDFSGRDLHDSSFTKANLYHSDLSHTNLQGVSFFGANLEEANLEGADLRAATLDTARLAKANLTNANLAGAFAFNAQFKGATIDGADFTDVDLRSDAQEMLCEVAQGKNPVTGRETRETLNCY